MTMIVTNDVDDDDNVYVHESWRTAHGLLTFCI